MIEVDRSRIISFQRCPRKRLYGYHIHGKGLQRRAKSLPLQFGSAYHEGCPELLAGDVDAAVGMAVGYIRSVFADRAVAYDGPAATWEYGREEQEALAEALIRGWNAVEGEQFREQFRIFEVEEEGRADLDDTYVLMYRPDAVVQDRYSGDCYVLSWKTTAYFDDRVVKKAKIDMQSMSEVFGLVESKKLKIEGVLYRWIVKSYRKTDKFDGIKKQQTPLVYAWKRLGGDVPEWSWCFSWDKEDGSGEAKLGKVWKRVPVWKEYEGGVKQWIEDLAAQKVAPRHLNALSDIFPQPLPVERSPQEIARWRRQITAQEQGVAISLEAVEEMGWTEEALDRYFPQHTDQCMSYNTPCEFWEICHDGVAAEPGELYQIRSANHPETEEED